MDIHKKDNDLNYGKICFFNQNSLFLFMYFFFCFKENILFIRSFFKIKTYYDLTSDF